MTSDHPSPLASALGRVVDDRDPQHLGRVRVRYVIPGGGSTSAWARVLRRRAAAGDGDMALPPMDTEVLLAFPGGNPHAPVVVGSLFNTGSPPPYANDDGENKLSRWRFASLDLEIDRAAGAVEIRSHDGRLHVHLDAAGMVRISAASEVHIAATEALTLSADQITLSADDTLTVEAPAVRIEADRVCLP